MGGKPDNESCPLHDNENHNINNCHPLNINMLPTLVAKLLRNKYQLLHHQFQHFHHLLQNWLKTKPVFQAKLNIIDLETTNRCACLRWFGNVEMVSCWASEIRKHEVDGCRRSKPRKTWSMVVTNDMKVISIAANMISNWSMWRRAAKIHVTSCQLINGQTT